MPATGVFAPERMFVAVRAIAPVAGKPPKSGENILATPWPTSSTFGLCLVLLDAVRNDRRHEGLDRAQHRDSDGRRNQRPKQIESNSRHGHVRQARGNATEARTDRFHRELEDHDERRSGDQRHNVAGKYSFT